MAPIFIPQFRSYGYDSKTMPVKQQADGESVLPPTFRTLKTVKKAYSKKTTTGHTLLM